jgi:WD40 repeat protein
MGVVYKAWHEPLRRVVALKMMLADRFAGAETRDRFRREAEAVARLQHPNIVQVFDVGEHDGQPFFTLEYLDGGTLAERQRGQPQPPRQAAEWVEILARAVHHAHEHDVLHRDLKPQNVLLSGDGRLKVGDFGLAKLRDGGGPRTRSSTVLGTPEYMAPEQATGAGGGPAVDVYALGVILYDLLTGRPPFQAATPLQTLRRVCEENPVPPHHLQPGLPRDLETLCLKCLEKDPKKRYASALDLADDLRRFRDGRPVVARPSPAWERAAKWARRRPAVAGLSAAVVGVTALGLVLVSWLWLRAEDRAARARQAEGVADERRRKAEEAEARLALHQGQALGEQGDIRRGLLWLARGLERADSAGARALERPLRVNLAEWADRLDRPLDDLHHSAAVRSLTFDPTGHRLLAGGADGRILTWDVATGREAAPARRFPGTDQPWVTGLAFRPDGRQLVAGGQAQSILWDPARPTPEGTLREDPPERVWAVAFLADGRLVTACFGGAHIWDLEPRPVVRRVLWHKRGGVCFALAVRPDGRILATAGDDKRALLWNLETGKRVGPELRHDSAVLAADFSPDGTRLLTGTADGTLHAWDLRSGRATDLPSQGTRVSGLRFSPDGRWLATATTGGLARLWDAVTLRPSGPVYRFAQPVLSLAFSPDGRRLAFGTDDGTIHQVELPASRAVGRPLRLPAELHAVWYTPDGRRLLTGCRDGMRWWDAATDRPLGEIPDNRDGYDVECTTLGPDGTFLALGRWSGAVGSRRGRAALCDAATGRRRWETPDQPSRVCVAAFSPDGRTLFLSGNQAGDGGTGLWDVATGRHLRTLLRALGPVHVSQAVFLPDGRTLLLTCDDGRARLWDVTADAEVEPDRPLLHASAVTACALDRTGERALTGCQDGTATLWDLGTRRPLLAPLRHEGEVSAVAFSPDGRTLLTGSFDGTARFGDAATGEPLGPPLRHADAVRAVAFRPDGRRVVTGSKDHTAQQWLVPAAPREGDPASVRRWAEGLAGMELDEQGVVHRLSASEVEERRGRLAGP